MFCISCGKTIPDDANFCAYCGKPQKGGESRGPVEWEYTEYTHIFTSYGPKGAWYRQEYVFDYTDAQIKVDIWQKHQAFFLSEVQEWLDQGWTPISEVGPSAIQLTMFHAHWWSSRPTRTYPTTFSVKMRRIKKS